LPSAFRSSSPQYLHSTMVLSLHLRFLDVDYIVFSNRSTGISDKDFSFFTSFYYSASDLPHSSVSLVSDDLNYFSCYQRTHLESSFILNRAGRLSDFFRGFEFSLFDHSSSLSSSSLAFSLMSSTWSSACPTEVTAIAALCTLIPAASPSSSLSGTNV
jgi:hypothetical protein